MELLNIPYYVSHRKVKYPRLEFRTGKLLLILPFGCNPGPILDKHKRWIIKKTAFVEECLRQASDKRLVERTEEEFRNLSHSLIRKALMEIGERLNHIYFRMMRTKWASLSSNKNLTINRLMKYLPEHLLNYVIFHEIVHLKEKKHNDKFWKRISKRFDNCQELEKDLFVYWFRIAKNRHFNLL